MGSDTGKKEPKVIYADMDDVLCMYTLMWNMEKGFKPEIAYPQSQYGFFQNLPPMADAVSAAKGLLLSDNYDPYILTAPSIYNPMSYTEKRVWVETYLGMEFVNRLIISPNKGLLRGDILIDDHLAGRGQEDFQGEFIHFGSDTFPSWKSVMNHLGEWDELR